MGRRAEVRQRLIDLVESVIERLNRSGITDVPLQDEWRRLQALDPDEVEFCRATAVLASIRSATALRSLMR